MRKLSIILFLTLILYSAVSYLSLPFSNFDSTSYNVIGVLTLNGKSIYPDPAMSRHPYLPFVLYGEALAKIISSTTHIPQILIIKAVLTLFHLLSVYAVYLISKRGFKISFLYAVNPISLFITAFHGQFDIVPITLILFGIIALQKKYYGKVVFLLSLAITIKTWPILFVAPFLKRIPKQNWISLLLLPLISIIIYSLIFHTSPLAIFRVLLVYQGVGGVWGFGKVLSFISTDKLVLLLYKALFVFCILLYSIRQKKSQIIDELLTLFLLFFIFTPGFGLQWFLWLVPFLFLTKKPFISLFMSAIAMCLGIAYLSWPPFELVPSSVVDLVLFGTWPLFAIYFFLFFVLLKKKYTL